jgi:hypothetical protein
MCVQRFDDSLNSAIHITYRNSLRSSSMREPRDPLLKVVFFFFFAFRSQKKKKKKNLLKKKKSVLFRFSLFLFVFGFIYIYIKPFQPKV